MDQKKLRDMVESIVLEVLDEATYRKDRVEDFLSCLRGALGEYYKARYAELWGDQIPSLRAHWDREVDEHFMFGFDRLCRRRLKSSSGTESALDEALESLRDEIPSELAKSRYQASKSFELTDRQRMLELPSATTTEFFDRVRREWEARRDLASSHGDKSSRRSKK